MNFGSDTSVRGRPLVLIHGVDIAAPAFPRALLDRWDSYPVQRHCEPSDIFLALDGFWERSGKVSRLRGAASSGLARIA